VYTVFVISRVECVEVNFIIDTFKNTIGGQDGELQVMCMGKSCGFVGWVVVYDLKCRSRWDLELYKNVHVNVFCWCVANFGELKKMYWYVNVSSKSFK